MVHAVSLQTICHLQQDRYFIISGKIQSLCQTTRYYDLKEPFYCGTMYVLYTIKPLARLAGQQSTVYGKVWGRDFNTSWDGGAINLNQKEAECGQWEPCWLLTPGRVFWHPSRSLSVSCWWQIRYVWEKGRGDLWVTWCTALNNVNIYRCITVHKKYVPYLHLDLIQVITIWFSGFAREIKKNFKLGIVFWRPVLRLGDWIRCRIRAHRAPARRGATQSLLLSSPMLIPIKGRLERAGVYTNNWKG